MQGGNRVCFIGERVPFLETAEDPFWLRVIPTLQTIFGTHRHLSPSWGDREDTLSSPTPNTTNLTLVPRSRFLQEKERGALRERR